MAERNRDREKQHPNLKARILPHNTEAEQAALGCAMIDEYAPLHVLTALKENDFYSESHRIIFRAMKDTSEKNKPVDIVTLVEKLENMGEMETVGGLTYLTSLSNIVPSAANYRHYINIVKKNSTLRRLIESAQKITDKAFMGDEESDVLRFAESEIYGLAEKEDRSSLAHLKEGMSEAVDYMELIYRDPNANKGIPTGFKGLNDILGGFQQSDLVLIAARPGQGKTSIAMNFISTAALDRSRKTASGKPDPYKCAVFSLEMPSKQLAKRLLCSVAKVNMKHANSGKLSSAEWQKIYKAKSILDEAEIYIDDSSLTTPVEILSKCRRLKREKGLDLVMIDYLQLMSMGSRSDGRQQEVADITRTLKIAAKELDVPILLLSQMNRDIDKNKRRPQMSDLRESGAIEQDADIIMFIYREHDQTDTSVDDEKKNKVELIVAKHRNGEQGTVHLNWRGEFVTFEDPETKYIAPVSGDKVSFSGLDADEATREQLDGDIPPPPPIDEASIPRERKSGADDDDGHVTKGQTVEEIVAVPVKTDDDDSPW